MGLLALGFYDAFLRLQPKLPSESPKAGQYKSFLTLRQKDLLQHR